jgi:hypothetical protein
LSRRRRVREGERETARGGGARRGLWNGVTPARSLLVPRRARVWLVTSRAGAWEGACGVVWCVFLAFLVGPRWSVLSGDGCPPLHSFCSSSTLVLVRPLESGFLGIN